MLPRIVEEPVVKDNGKEGMCFDFGEIDFSFDVASKYKRMYQEVCDENMELLNVLTQHQKENQSQNETLEESNIKIYSLQKQLDIMAHTLSEEKEKKQNQEDTMAKDEIERRNNREELEKQLLKKENLIKDQKLAIDRANDDHKREKQAFDNELLKFETNLLKEKTLSSELGLKNKQLEVQLKKNSEDTKKEIEELKNDLEDRDQEIAELKQNVEHLLNNQICIQNILQVTKEEIKIVSGKLADKIVEIQGLENMNKTLESENVDIIKEVEFLKEEKQELTKHMDQKNRELKSRNKTIDELRHECEETIERNNVLLRELEEAEQMANDIKGKCKSYELSNASVLKELNEAKERIKIVVQDNQKLKKKISSNKTRDEYVVSNLFKLLELSKVDRSKRKTPDWCLISWFRKNRRNQNRENINEIMKPLNPAEEKYELVQTILSEFVEYW